MQRLTNCFIHTFKPSFQSKQLTSRAYSSGIFSKRESALEEKFILDHEKQVIEDLRKQLAEKEAKLQEKLKKIQEQESKNPTPAAQKADGSHDVRYSPMGGATSAFGKREVRFFYF